MYGKVVLKIRESSGGNTLQATYYTDAFSTLAAETKAYPITETSPVDTMTYDRPGTHTHLYHDDGWKALPEGHWRGCTYEGGTACDGTRIDEAEHTGNPCTVCGYTAPLSFTITEVGDYVDVGADLYTSGGEEIINPRQPGGTDVAFAYPQEVNGDSVTIELMESTWGNEFTEPGNYCMVLWLGIGNGAKGFLYTAGKTLSELEITTEAELNKLPKLNLSLSGPNSISLTQFTEIDYSYFQN
jgi:hypothetical protein